MVRNELAAIIEQLGKYQVEQIRKIAESFLSLNEELNDTTPKSCPSCKSTTARFCFVFLTEKCVWGITGRSFDLPGFALRLRSPLPFALWLPL